MITFLRNSVFILSISFIMLAIYSFTLAQYVPIEFQNFQTKHKYYNAMCFYFPLANLLTLTGTGRFAKSKLSGYLILGFTVLTSFFLFTIMPFFKSHFDGEWLDEDILFRKKSNSEVTIRCQMFYDGLSGYESRIVELTPLFEYWYQVKQIDISKIEKNDWIPINDEIIKY